MFCNHFIKKVSNFTAILIYEVSNSYAYVRFWGVVRANVYFPKNIFVRFTILYKQVI